MATANAQLTITPEMMAQAFWDMGSDEQIKFFEELANVISEDHKTNKHAYGLGELQWYFLSSDIEKNKQAKAMLMSISAPLYLHTLQFSESY